MNKFILFLFIIFLCLLTYGQRDNVIIAYSKDSTYKVENYRNYSCEASDSIIFKKLKTQKSLISHTLKTEDREEYESVLDCANVCAIRQLPIIYEILEVNDSIILLLGVYANLPVYYKHLIFVNVKRWEVVNKIVFPAIVVMDNISFMITEGRLFLPKLLNGIEKDKIYLLNNSTEEIKSVKSDNKMFYYDSGKAFCCYDSDDENYGYLRQEYRG